MVDVIGSYRIIGKIGEGGMGAVYVAEHTLIGRQAAIKVLQREMSHRQDLVTRFFNEARAATAVKHPGIVEIYDFGYHTDGSAYIVMEYLEGETLSARLRRGPLPAARVAAIGRQVAGALGAAHARGIIHRDLKPDNIFIVRDPDIEDGERTKILDFGIAKLAAGDQPGISKTRTGEVMGTPTYMSPEQSKGAGNVDARTDIYSLGCILFEMVCGRPPFVADGGGEVMAQHIFAPVPAPSSIAPVTPELEQFLLRALAKDPAHRFQSVEEMSAALRLVVPPGSLPHINAPSQASVSGAFVRMPAQTTLSAANATVRVPPVNRRRGWITPMVAVLAIAGGATAIAIGQRGGGGASAMKALEPVSSVPGARLPAPGTPAPPDPAQQAPLTHANPTPSAPMVTPSTSAPVPPTPTITPLAARTPAHVTIKLASEPRGAEVYRMPQGVRIGTAPLTYSTDAIEGEIVLIVKRRGYVDQQLAVPADRNTDQTVTLVRVATARPHEPQSPGSGSGSASTGGPQSGTLDPFDKLSNQRKP